VTALRNVVAAFSQPQNPLTALSTPTSPPAPPIPASTKILLVDPDQAFAAQIHALLTSWEIQTQIVSDCSSARAAITADQPDLILLDLSLPNEDGFELLAELNRQPSAIPIIAMMSQSQLSDRVAVARLGGHGFLQKPVSPEQLSQAIRQMLRLTQPSAFHILLVDDDPHICTVIKTLLEPWDLSVTCIENPLLFWNVLETCTPSLLILDIEMPHFNGLELCQVVRNDLRWNELPILILSAHNNTDIVRQVFTVGADDYVSKPIVDAELIARVLNRLERSQRHRLK
jgi:DNA-binding response OmpR family regulator